jgi:tryptophanase
MKKLFFSIAIILIASSSFAQNATLTKTETVAYIDKKIKEIASQQTPKADGFFYSLWNYMQFTDGMATIGFAFLPLREVTYKFNPAYIKDVTSFEQGKATGWIRIGFASNAVAISDGGTKKSSDAAFLPYAIGDGTNFEKLKKALLHLQSLLKAEDDPFAN